MMLQKVIMLFLPEHALRGDTGVPSSITRSSFLLLLPAVLFLLPTGHG